jgi:hypothetical protein
MGRTASPDTKVQIGGRVAPIIKLVIDEIADREQRTASQTLEILLKESPRIKAKLRENGKRVGK